MAVILRVVPTCSAYPGHAHRVDRHNWHLQLTRICLAAVLSPRRYPNNKAARIPTPVSILTSYKKGSRYLGWLSTADLPEVTHLM